MAHNAARPCRITPRMRARGHVGIATLLDALEVSPAAAQCAGTD
jgi:hypothetical protein